MPARRRLNLTPTIEDVDDGRTLATTGVPTPRPPVADHGDHVRGASRDQALRRRKRNAEVG